MDTVLRFRGRAITTQDVEQIRALIAEQPKATRRALSRELSAAWGMTQANGASRDMVCRSLMLALHRAGLIQLPPVKYVRHNPLARRTRPEKVEIDCTPLETLLAALGPLTFRQVRRTAQEGFFNSLIETHHYLGYVQPVGEHLKYLVLAGERPLACFAWSSAPRHLGPRDRYIGWTMEARRRNIRFVAYNSRYLIMPWVHVPHLASHLLGRMTRMLSAEWTRVYGHPIHFVETFVEPARFAGTCYRAANWALLGETTGRGKDDLTHKANRTIKNVLGLALTRKFREQLGSCP
jgi:hypothetical protein